MDARKRLIIIKGKDQTDSVASFQFRDGKCEVVFTALSATERKIYHSVETKCSSSKIA